jgi:hypothetical protein
MSANNKYYIVIVVVIVIALAAGGAYWYWNKKTVSEGFWNIPTRTVKVERVLELPTKDGPDFFQTPHFQGILSPRFSNVNYGPNLRTQLPGYDTTGVPADPLGGDVGGSFSAANSGRVSGPTIVMEGFNNGNGGSWGEPARLNVNSYGNVSSFNDSTAPTGDCGYGSFSSPPYDRMNEAERVLLDPHNPSSYANGNYKEVLAMGMAPDSVSDVPSGPTGSFLTADGELKQPIVYDRYLYANRQSRLRNLGDPIRGDLPIVPASGNWFTPNVHPNVDLQAGAINVLAGVNNETSHQLASLIYNSSGGGDTTIGGGDTALRNNETRHQLASASDPSDPLRVEFVTSSMDKSTKLTQNAGSTAILNKASTSNYFDVEDRMATFRKRVPELTPIKAKELADRGFYHANNDVVRKCTRGGVSKIIAGEINQIKCFHCGLSVIDERRAFDNIDAIPRDCDYIKLFNRTVDNGEWCVIEKEEPETTDAIDDKYPVINLKTREGIPELVDYSIAKNRLASFPDWLLLEKTNIEAIKACVNAGFYYIGPDKQVKCWGCEFEQFDLAAFRNSWPHICRVIHEFDRLNDEEFTLHPQMLNTDDMRSERSAYKQLIDMPVNSTESLTNKIVDRKVDVTAKQKMCEAPLQCLLLGSRCPHTFGLVDIGTGYRCPDCLCVITKPVTRITTE